MNTSSSRSFDVLVIAAVAFAVANLLHTADHLRQRMAGVDIEIMIAGTGLTVAAVVVAIAALRRHRLLPLLATVIGFTAAASVAASHLLPHWGALSDSYVTDIHPDGLSWAVMLFEFATGLLLGFIGLHRLRTTGRGQPGALGAQRNSEHGVGQPRLG
jgi:hypothetical protein